MCLGARTASVCDLASHGTRAHTSTHARTCVHADSNTPCGPQVVLYSSADDAPLGEARTLFEMADWLSHPGKFPGAVALPTRSPTLVIPSHDGPSLPRPRWSCPPTPTAAIRPRPRRGMGRGGSS